MITWGKAVRRLWRPRALASIGGPLVVIFAISLLDRWLLSAFGGKRTPQVDVIHYGLVLVGALIAIYAVRAFTQTLGQVLDDYLGLGRARSVATLISVILYALVILTSINATGYNLNGLLVGGAVTGVVVGIAGQASLSNIIAGLVLLFARPYTAGMNITARAGVFGGVEYSGQVYDVSLFYTTLISGEQRIRIPNSVMIGAVVTLRPEEMDVTIPVVLPRASTPDIVESIARLRQAVTSCVPEQRLVTVTLDGVTVDGYGIGVRAFVAGREERGAIEEAITRFLRDEACRAEAGTDGQPGGENASISAAPAGQRDGAATLA